MKRQIGFLFPLISLTILILGLSLQMFNFPPLGKLLDPFEGIVQNGYDNLDYNGSIHGMAGLSNQVKIFFDERKVPHIYASNTEDLYFAQGYITASLRLWQMDFVSYISAGRLSELFRDPSYLDYDRRQRRMGFLQAARESLSLMQKDNETVKLLSAYTKGVNAYITGMEDRNMPLEYKFLNYRPEPWTNLKSVLILKYMSGLLTGYGEDLAMSKAIITLGQDQFNRIYSDYNNYGSPIINDSSQVSAQIPSFLQKPNYLDYSFLSSGTVLPPSLFNPKLGSNSWAVSGKKTSSGFPILCNDPHLGLSLPAIWLEFQLTAPGINVYGVSIPGTPSIIIGFNRDIAWGLTNGLDDVMDWYKLKISNDLKNYEFEGEWKKMQLTVEEIKRKGQRSFFDTIYHTIHGPIVYDKRFVDNQTGLLNFALRWEMHRPSNEFLTFILLNKAKNYKDYDAAIRHYTCPVQNFTFICKNNDIAVNHQGKIPVKWPGQGKFILDGTKCAHLYRRYIPEDSLPHLLNPYCNYVFSANQRPTREGYPYYYNGYFLESRANRIHELLEKENNFDIAKMERMQTENTNSFAAKAIQELLARVDNSSLNSQQQHQLQVLNLWKGAYDFDDTSANFFETWWKNVVNYTWDELKSYDFPLPFPNNYILLDLIRTHYSDPWFDVKSTSPRENAMDIITSAFIDALKESDKQKEKGLCKWSDFNKVSMMHMTYIPAFSRVNIPLAGHPDAINATSGGWGPSWRMIVELGDRPKAYGVYPGGQSGNICSNYYDNFIETWSKSRYYPLHFYLTMKEAQDNSTSVWILRQ